jgi:hypothetical protein
LDYILIIIIIGDEGISKLSEILKYNTTLTTLYLSDNNIGNEGASKLSDALKYNTTLTELHLYNNNIGDEGGTSELSEALKKNTTLIRLSLYNNNIKNENVIKEIDNKLEINKKIQIKKEKFIIEIFNKSRIILLSKEKGYFSKLTFELIVYIFYFLQDYPYQYLSYQQIKLICQYSSQKKTLGLLTKKKLIQSIKLNL